MMSLFYVEGLQRKLHYMSIKCKHCGKCFSKPCKLRIHERNHTGEKPYECKQCDMRFSEAGKLKRHERIHTGVKPYE